MKPTLGLNSQLQTEFGNYQIETSAIPLLARVVCKVFREGKVIDLTEADYDPEISEQPLLSLVQSIHTGKFEELESLFRIGAEVMREARADFYNKLGLLFVRRGLLDEAATVFLKGLEMDKKFIGLYGNLGKLYALRHEWERSLAIYGQGLSIDPNQVEFHYERAVAYEKLGRTAEAEAELKKALAIKRDWAKAQLELAVVVLRHSPSSALRLLRASQEDPRYRSPLVADALGLIEAGQVEEAGKLLGEFRQTLDDEAVSYLSEEFDLLIRYADPQKKPFIIESYIEQIRTKLAQNPDQADLHHELGKIYLLAIKSYWDRGINEFKRALALDPTITPAKQNLELAQYELKGFLLFLRGLSK
jgi:tetratricopeptide (TPR) repeat protein